MSIDKSLRSTSLLALSLAAFATGCGTVGGAANPSAPTGSPSTVSSPKQAAIAEWNFADGETGGWRMGWNKTEETAITDFDAEPKLGLKLTMDFHSAEWGDANIKLAWTEEVAPAAVSVRILIPASIGRPKGPMQIGCAMNMPWTEAKSWPEVKPKEEVTIDGVAYLAQTLTCRLGTSDKPPVPRELVVRFGGEKVRYKGPLYVQQIRALRETN